LPGFAGDGLPSGSGCNDIDECAEGLDNCALHASCVNTIGSFTCSCDAGFISNGTDCLDIDECIEAPCASGEACVNGPGGYTCVP